jgi:hypothetical protein
MFVELTGSTGGLLAYLVALTSDAEHCPLCLQARVPRLSNVVLRAAETAFDRGVLALGPIWGREKLFLVIIAFIKYLHVPVI